MRRLGSGWPVDKAVAPAIRVVAPAQTVSAERTDRRCSPLWKFVSYEERRTIPERTSVTGSSTMVTGRGLLSTLLGPRNEVFSVDCPGRQQQRAEAVVINAAAPTEAITFVAVT
jgi:hypothetical protein